MNSRRLVVWYQVAAFVGAAQLFLVQPLLARLHLPLFGGAPAVWTTAMLFFQALLLIGYSLAHASLSRWSPAAQAHAHLAVLPFALCFLPFVPATLADASDPANTPVASLLLALGRCAGVPFLLLAMTAPTLQRWFAATDDPRRSDPYFLYAASNAGSLTALLAYPLVVEPLFTVSQQCRLWAGGYLIFMLLMAGCALNLWIHPTDSTTNDSAPDKPGDGVAPRPLDLRRRGWWLLLAFVPASLSLAVTTTLTTDVAPVPLLWVVPLSLYLATYVIAFAPRARPIGRTTRWLYALLLPLYLTVLACRVLSPWWLVTGFHLTVLFVVAMIAHTTLAADRPPVAQLTEYYIIISLGGVLGGIANSLLAPHLLNTVTEYPLTMLCAVAVLVDAAAVSRIRSRRERIWFYMFGFALTVALARLIHKSWEIHPDDTAGYLLAGLLIYGLADYWPRLQGTLVVLAIILRLCVGDDTSHVVHQSRNFFGAVTVNAAASATVHLITHGNTFHGGQDLDVQYRDIPLFYYYPEGPIGQVFAMLNRRVRPLRVAIIGLGCGAVAAYGRYGQHFTFFEIDPQIVAIAKDPALFRYVGDCRSRLDIEVGDGRFGLQRAASESFDMIVVDAYNSDAIPLHLCTREAMMLYLSRLKPEGLLMVHLSHRYLNLETVFGNLAWGMGLSGRIQNYNPKRTPPANADEAVFVSLCSWALIARDLHHFGDLARDERWRPLRVAARSRMWTDDYTSVVSIYNWQ